MISTSPVFIETPRLILRELNPVICKKVFETYSGQGIMDYLGLSSIAELQLEQERFQQGLTMFGRTFNYFHLIVKESNTIIGWCGYHTIYTTHNRAELGYVLSHDKDKGCGYMKEALPHVVRYGFEVLNLNRIEAYIAEENIASYKLLKGNSFVKEGVLKEHYNVNGTHEDSLLFSLLKTNFSNKQ
jgi:[ribosomal protein S5]-alanine N-acetyltransferase